MLKKRNNLPFLFKKPYLVIASFLVSSLFHNLAHDGPCDGASAQNLLRTTLVVIDVLMF